MRLTYPGALTVVKARMYGILKATSISISWRPTRELLRWRDDWQGPLTLAGPSTKDTVILISVCALSSPSSAPDLNLAPSLSFNTASCHCQHVTILADAAQSTPSSPKPRNSPSPPAHSTRPTSAHSQPSSPKCSGTSPCSP